MQVLSFAEDDFTLEIDQEIYENCLTKLHRPSNQTKFPGGSKVIR